MKELDAKLMSLTNNDKSFEIDRSYLLELASKTRRIFESSKPEKKNKILKLLFSNLEINEKRLNCNPLEPFNASSTMSKFDLAPAAGLEPATYWLTANR
ncbi:MAG: hypothetical protein KFF74_00915 [Candidatus Nanosynbacter sp.]|nr:hypothetical protein [Candidatus Nanosynbacter sp.]